MNPSLLLLFLLSFPLSTTLQQQLPCNNNNNTHCKTLPTLGAHLSWTFTNSTPNFTLHVTFTARATSASGWVAWGLNPGPRPAMAGTRALLASLHSGVVSVATYDVSAIVKRGCKLSPSPVDVGVDFLKANYSAEEGTIAIAAVLTLPSSVYDPARVDHVWQVGGEAVRGSPERHAMRLENLDSGERFSLISGRSSGYKNIKKLRYAHGSLSIIGWGILLPTGVIIIRYLTNIYPPHHVVTITFMHIACQITGFLIGSTAWAIGIYLMYNSIPSNSNTFKTHRNIGITIFCLGATQITSLWLKPKKQTSYRKLWNIGHHSFGYILLTLIILNIFKGFEILRPLPYWRWAYVGWLIFISLVAFIMEIITWKSFLLNRKDET